MSAVIIRTILDGMAEGGGALGRIMADQGDEFVEAIAEGRYEEFLTRSTVEGAEELLTNSTFVRIMGRLGGAENLRELENLEGALRAGGDISEAVFRLLGDNVDPASDLGRAIASSLDEAAQLAATGTDEALETGAEALARARAAAAGGEQVPRAAGFWDSAPSRRAILGWTAGTAAVTTGGIYIYAALEDATGGALARGTVSALFDAAERRIEAGVDLETVFQDLRDNADLIQFIMDPTNNARQQGAMQLAYDAWERGLQGEDPTPGDITSLKSQALLNYMGQDGISFGVHAALIRWEASELLERGEITEEEFGEVYVDRFSAFLAEQLNYSVLEENGHGITAEDVETILRTDPHIAGRILQDIPTETAALIVREMPELAESQPQLARFIEEGGLHDETFSPESGAARLGLELEGPGALAALANDPMGILGAAGVDFATDLRGMAASSFRGVNGALDAGLDALGVEDPATQNLVKGIAAFFVIGRLAAGMTENMSGLRGAAADIASWGVMFTVAAAFFRGENAFGGPGNTGGAFDQERLAADEDISADGVHTNLELDRMALGPLPGDEERRAEAVPTVAEEMDRADLQGGYDMTPGVLPSGAQLDTYQTMLNSVNDIAMGFSTYSDDPQLALSLGADIETALEAGDTRAAATIAHDGLQALLETGFSDNISAEDREYLTTRANEALDEIRSGAETLGISLGEPEVAALGNDEVPPVFRPPGVVALA